MINKNNTALLSRVDARLRGRIIVTISGHHRCGLADDEQWVALCPIRTKPESTARCHTPQKVVSTKEGARYQANCRVGPREPFKKETAYLAKGANEVTYRVLGQPPS